MVDARGLFHVLLGNTRDSLNGDVIDADAGVESERGKNGALGGRVEALDVRGRVGLGETEILRLLESLLVAEALRAHRVQDEVGRAIHDAHDGRNAVTRKGLAQAVDDGDGTRDGCLVVEVGTIGCGGLVELGAVSRQEGLVTRHDRDALVERTQHEGAGGLDAANQLDDEVHVFDRLGRVRRQQLSINRSITAGIHIADEDLAHLHFCARASGEILAARLKDANDLATDGSGSKNANSEDGAGCRHRIFLLCGTGTGTSVGGQASSLLLRTLVPQFNRQRLWPHILRRRT